MRKLITFLGKYPKETQYLHEGQTYTGRVFGEALREFVDFDAMLVFTTAEAEKTTWPVLKALRDPRIQQVSITTGEDAQELWSLFERLTQVVDRGDTVIFDITHGLRSIPFLIFLAAAYLKEACDVTIEAIYYGAYELGQPAPVIDLSEFVTLLDWLTATNQFIYTGDGHYLAGLLRDAGHFEHPRRRLTPEEREAETLAKRINGVADAITRTSQALLTNLIPHAEEASATLLVRLAEAREDLGQQAPPYRLLADRVRSTYEPLAAPHPLTDDVRRDLEVQLAMIAWYMRKGHLPQAFTLIREWVVTAVGHRLGLQAHDLLDYRGRRRDIESALGRNSALWQTAQPESTTSPAMIQDLQDVVDTKDLADFWNQVTDFRNFINHGAMRSHWSQRPIKTVMASGETLYDKFLTLATALLEEAPCSS
jgi:CRISPR-associated DxTHG motif protein